MTDNHPQSIPAAGQQPGTAALTAWFAKKWLHCLILALLGVLVRIPALQGEPVWDDDYLIRTNSLIKSPLLILETFRHYLFLDTFSLSYRPVQNLSYLFDYLIWNNNFYGYHLTSLACHVAGGILLYFLLQSLLPSLLPEPVADGLASRQRLISWNAFFVALVWLVHPVHSAAVDYVSGRADSLAFLFACSAWLLFLTARRLTSAWMRVSLFGLAWGSGLLALCSRETGIVWLVIFGVYSFAFERSSPSRQKWLVTIGCVMMVVCYYLLRSLPGAATVPDDPAAIMSPLLRVVLMFRSLGDYGRLMLWPSNLHMERTVYNPKAYQTQAGRWSAIEHEYLSVAGLLVLVGLVILSIKRGRGQKARLFGAVWFFIAYLPISNLINLNATVAEHWLYLPSVGLIIFAVGCMLDLPAIAYRPVAVFGCVAVIGLAGRSISRSADWTSNETFAQSTIASGGATPRLVLLLAQAYSSRQDYPAAEKLLRRAVESFPDYPLARNNLADALAHQGKEKEAEEMFRHCSHAAENDRKGYSLTWVAALNLSKLRHREHDDGGAIAILEKARQDYPDTWELISAETELLRETGKIETALQVVQEFAQKKWWHYRAWLAYGRLLAQKGDGEASLAALRHASWLDIHETTALNSIAMIRVRENRLDEAWRTQRRAVARQPDEPTQYVLLSDILEKMGRGEEARAALAKVSRLRAIASADIVRN
ncbi:MAG TPA: tetratricopeptide repeat protein [Chthoniobacterales bacterium]|jgi:Flp pilus assembly protein TadD